MFDLFKDLKAQISTSGISRPHVTSLIFSCMKICMLITTLACVLVTAKNYIGDNIKCITGFEKQEHKAIETYCFIASTFTVIDLDTSKSAHPGVGPNAPVVNEEGEKEEVDDRRHAYYQWVPMVLMLQAVMYYLPAWFWSKLDKGFFETTLCKLDKIHIGGANRELTGSAKYFASSIRTHRGYAVTFFMCECAAFAISVGNLFFTNTFLGGEFFQFGPAALKYLGASASDPSNPLNDIFPKVAKCTWHKFGASGSIQTFDSMCVLPLNIVNEKTYIFLWVVYILAAAVCGVALLFHFILLLVPSLRNTVLVHMAKTNETQQDLLQILSKCNYGDWFLMYHFRANMVYFREWVAQVKEEMRK